MKILILSCNTGGGHNSAAASVKECFENGGYRCDIFDTLALFSKSFSRAVSRGHVFVYRHMPRLFGVTYRFEEKHNNKMLYQANALAADELYKYLKENNYDAVIAVHVFAELTLTEIRRKYDSEIKMYFVATDYTCSPGVSMGDMDGYFVPMGLKEEFARCGVPRDKIIESGIPVRKEFLELGDKKSSKRSLGLDESGRNILLMCGSMGAGPIATVAEKLSKGLPEDVTLTVVCGSNKKLYDELLPLDGEKVRIMGFTDRVPELMDASELMISKPGGLSTTEALSKRLPLICINAVPGCETRNLEFLSEKGYVLHENEAEDLALLALSMISSPKKLSALSDKISREFDPHAAKRIYDHVCEVYEKDA